MTSPWPTPAFTIPRAPAATSASIGTLVAPVCPYVMSTRGSESSERTSNSEAIVCRRSGRRWKCAAPPCMRPSRPNSGESNASGLEVRIFVASRAAWIASFIATSAPMPTAAELAASATALYRFIGPSAESALAGRIAPVSTIGFSERTVSVIQ